MNVALGSGVSGNVSVAIYADASGQPGQTTVPAGAPICSGGPVAATSGTVSTTLSNCQLTGGLTYWLAKNSDTASGTETVQNWYCNQGSPTSVSEHVSWTFGTWPGELPSPVPYSQQCNAMYAVVSPLSTAPAATATALGLRPQDAWWELDVSAGRAVKHSLASENLCVPVKSPLPGRSADGIPGISRETVTVNQRRVRDNERGG